MLRVLLAASLLLLLGGSLLAASSAQDSVQDRFEQEVRGELRRHPHLSRIQFAWVHDHPPFVFLVQEPEGAGADHAEEVVAKRLEWLGALEARFRASYAGPMRLRLRPDRPRLVVVILSDQEELRACVQAAGDQLAVGDPAWYDEGAGFLVLREPPPATPLDRHVELNRAARLLVQGHRPPLEEPSGPFWLWLGLADDLAAHRGETSESLGRHELSLPALDALVQVLREPGARQSYLPRLGVFLAQPDFPAVIQSCGASAASGFTVDPRKAASAYAAMSSVLFHYLSFDASAPLPERMKDYTALAIKNRLGGKALPGALGGIDLDGLEGSFWEYVWSTARRELPRAGIDSGHLRDFLAARGLAEAKGEVVVATGSARLFETLVDPDARLALAIAHARSGDFESALRMVDGALAASPPAAAAARLERERQRLAAWIAERDAFLEHLVASGEKLSIEHEKKKLSAKVTEVKTGRIFFEQNRAGIESLAIDELDPVELADCMHNRRSSYEAGWAAAYPGVLALDSKVKRLLRGEGPELAALAEDFESDYPERCEAIAVAESLVALSDAAEDESSEAVPRALELIGEVWARKGKASFLEPLHDELHSLAETLYGRRFDEKGAASALAGEVQVLADGRLRIRYDFSKAQQLDDWVLEETPGRRHAGYGELKTDRSSFEWAGGKLLAIGQTSYTHRLQLEGPQSISCRCRILSGGESEEQREMSFEVSLCNGPRMARVGILNAMGLDVIDAKTGELHRQAPEEVKIHYDTDYVVRLEHDGRSQVKFLREGEELFSDSCHGNLRGPAALFLHSDYAIEFDDVELVGRPTDASVRGLREAWVAARVGEMGL